MSILMFALALTTSDPGQPGQPGWRPLGQRDGVKSWIRTDPGEDVPRLRGEVEIEAELFEVLGVLHDVRTSCEWTPQCRESRLIRDLSRFSSYIYLRTACPWPVADRDVVLKTVVSIKPDGSEARAEFSAVELPDVPVVDGVVRLTLSSGAYALTRLGPTRTRVRYELHTDPSGNVPGALARRALEPLPHDQLVALARRAAEMRGKYTQFQDEYDPTRRKD